jgi:hypothetical protein
MRGRFSVCVVLRKPGGVTRWTGHRLEAPLLTLRYGKDGGPATT